MSDVPVELVVAAFPDEHGAERALEQLKQAKKEKLISIRDAAVITRDSNDKLTIHETRDMGVGRGAGIGALIGGAVGILFPPAVLGAASVGGAIGGLGAKLHDAGFPDKRLKELGAALKPGTSAIVAVIEHKWVAEIERELAAQGAQLVRQTIKEDITRQLEAGQGVAFTVLADQDTIVLGRAVQGQPDAASTETSPPVE
jgi:uncharacterized membrane protein